MAQTAISLMFLLIEIFLSVTLGSITILPGVLLLHVVNQTCRFFVSAFLWLIYGEQIILNPTGYDGMYMYEGHKHGKRMILYLAIQEGPIDIESHRQSYMNHLVNLSHYQKLKKIWTRRLGYFCLKEDTTFCIKNHVKVYKGLEQSNGTRVVTEDELFAKILPELSNDMDESCPQWEDVIIPRFQYKNCDEISENKCDTSIKSLRIFRIHHGYMDGLSTMLMLAYSQSEGKNFPWIIDPLSAPRRSVISKLLYYTFFSLTFSSRVFINLLNPPCAIKNRWHVRNFTGESVYSWSKPLSMSLLQQIKNDSGASMPAILCSILISSLRKVEEKFESEDPEYQGKISEEIVIGLVAALLPYQDLELRNQHCILKCNLNSQDLSRTDRLREVNNEMIRLSTSTEVYLNFFLPQLYGGMPGWFSDKCTSLIAGCGVVSNFPAANRKVKFWGNEVKEMAGWVPLITPAGFGCVTLRYADYLRFCLNADKASLPKEQLSFLVETITNEAELLSRDCSAQKIKESSVNKIINDKNVKDYNENLISNSEEAIMNHRIQRALDRVMSSVNKIKKA